MIAYDGSQIHSHIAFPKVECYIVWRQRSELILTVPTYKQDIVSARKVMRRPQTAKPVAYILNLQSSAESRQPGSSSNQDNVTPHHSLNVLRASSDSVRDDFVERRLC